MSKRIRWLREQLGEWERRGILTRAQAEEIRALHPLAESGVSAGTLVFGALGAGIAGLGIILLFAYNWQAMGKAAKLAIVLCSLAGAHAGGLWLGSRRPDRRWLTEILCALGSMLFGAGIWLIAQIYNIEEHFPNGFLIWAVGTLLLAWALRSTVQGVLAAVLFPIWIGVEGWQFSSPVHSGWLWLAGGVGALAWHLRSRMLLALVLVGLCVSALALTNAVDDQLILRVLLNLGACFVAVGALVRGSRGFPGSAPVWSGVGWPVVLLSLYLLTFSGVTTDLLKWSSEGRTSWEGVAYNWIPWALAVAPWALLLWRRVTAPAAGQETLSSEHWFVPASIAAAQLIAGAELAPRGGSGLVTGLFNLILLAIAAAWMARGCLSADLRQTMAGSLVFIALVMARYFDLFQSLAVRGLIFVALGGLLVAQGILFRRARRLVRAGEQPA